MNDRQKSPRSGLPRGIWALGLVSLFMDISSEMIHALLPAFLVGTLGASVAFVGLVEGLGEGLANIVKLFSRRISDRIGRRKPLALLGYGLGTVSKPIFALATGPYWVLTARLSDRFGKGMRGAPRDALVAALAPEGKRGAAFGLRQSLDNVGAFAGPLLALLFLSLFAGDMRARSFGWQRSPALARSPSCGSPCRNLRIPSPPLRRSPSGICPSCRRPSG